MAVCSRVKAFLPSPYHSGMLTSKIPHRQYAISSTLVVSLRAAHDILLATANSPSPASPCSTAAGYPRDLAQHFGQPPFVPPVLPLAVEEYHFGRGDQLL